MEELVYGEPPPSRETQSIAEHVGAVARQGMRSLPALRALRKRILAFYNVESLFMISMEMVIDWIRTLANAQPQTRAEYLKCFKRMAHDLRIPWDMIFLDRYLAGLQASAPPPTQARPMSIVDFRSLRTHPDPLTRLAVTYTFLTGSRLAETFLITPRMFTKANAREVTQDSRLRESHVIIKVETWNTSKTGQTDPSALRFADVAMLSQEEYEVLRPRLQQEGPVFPAETKHNLEALLHQSNYSGHSLKRGTAGILSALLAEGRIQAPTIPFILKHSDPLQRIPSVTAAYLSPQARTDVLRALGIFQAALELRNRMVGDCFI